MNLKEMVLNHLNICTRTRSGEPDHIFNIQKFIITEYCSNEYLHQIFKIPVEDSVFDGNDYNTYVDLTIELFRLPLVDIIQANVHDVISNINDNIENGNIEVNRDLNSGEYSILNLEDCELIDLSNTNYLISYMPWHINEDFEKVEAIKQAIVDISYHTKEDVVSYDEIKFHLEFGDDYPYNHFSRNIQKIHNNDYRGHFLNHLIEKSFYNFIADDITTSKSLGNHPIYTGQFSTIVFVSNDQYNRYYLTNKDGFRDLLHSCLEKDYILLEQHGNQRMLVYLNDSVDKLDEIKRLDAILVSMDTLTI